ncbi:hypothetical protein HDZ31DRAFT_65415 [Schizophyllum fasciatum]
MTPDWLNIYERNWQPCVLDATRVSDGKRVVLRKAETWKDELPIYQRLSRLPNVSRNRLAPVLDVLLLPDTDEDVLLVLPLLREYYDPPFSRVEQVVQCLTQFMEALLFMHEQDIAHRDFCTHNLMMDASHIVPTSHHFAAPYLTPDSQHGLTFCDRTVVPLPDYFVIDLGLAIHMPNGRHSVLGMYGQDKTVPELSWEEPYDPFMVDIYQFGNVIMRDMVDLYDGLDFLRPLAERMVQRDPCSRPAISEAFGIFLQAVKDLPPSGLQQSIQLTKRFSGHLLFAVPEEELARGCC